MTCCSVTVAAGRVTQMHTGRSRILTEPPHPATPTWQTAAGRGRVLLALVRPGVLDPEHATGKQLGPEGWAGLDTAVQAGAVLAGLADARTDPEPYGRRW
ncbi:hypothetical protein [Streptomyces sp. SCL15-4]|uniref:hypothetical protein n=1 Tax=Streptomyces sp. SCL15-4 TaxID=2967221 RepID=UPI002966EC20|nr:hypothetical protein [Streptomyces sp. SCL15-4]